ncbi:hypothetical protein RHMOL_Rhmol06G0167200 [Rhododendron molle]|uniref:Uncharacterized protein n=1 Tax=Rhododendron molle TaxID=49168 RepID=A0ACC0ND99_RHOML|nr:hypothetical protein RHMOL_Rhmol06G0167200 [Rhododendron molle]
MVDPIIGIRLCVDHNSTAEVKQKWKHKSIEHMLGILKPKKRGGKRKQKCVQFRSAVTIAALSSDQGINNTNEIILAEAQAIWGLDEARGVWDFEKTQGIGHDGEEEEVISRIAHMG